MPLSASPARAGGCRVAEGERSGDPGQLTAPPRRTGLLIAVAAAVVVADQLTKAWALTALADGPIGIVGGDGGIRFYLTYNMAGAFGLGGAAVPFLALAAFILVVVMASSGATTRSPALASALGLVLGGAVGNLADRLFRGRGWLRGAVVDFVDLRVWPVFNLADAAITCGCILLVLAGWRSKD